MINGKHVSKQATRRARCDFAKQAFNLGLLLGAGCVWLFAPFVACGADPRSVPRTPRASNSDFLSADDWKSLDRAVDRGLAFLATTQQSDGSFAGPREGQPAITSLCVMAFLSRGHVPHHGEYGAQIDRAIDYVLSTQRPDGFLYHRTAAPGPQGTYNHAISGLMLGEVYGMTEAAQRDRVREAIRKAVRFTRELQQRPKLPGNQGGWRYVEPNRNDADLSVTSWHVMFLRSARNAEFEVPKEYIDEALGFVRRAFDPNRGGFVYRIPASHGRISRATVGGGALILSLGGEHQTDMARAAGKWILQNDFRAYNRGSGGDRYHYAAYYCSMAMFQLGEDYWRQFFPPFLRTMLAHQHQSGAWDREAEKDGMYGDSYTSALAILSLTPPYQLLPIYQR